MSGFKNKYLLFIAAIFLVLNCSGPKKIRSSENLFKEISLHYDLNEYNIRLKTSDSIFYLSKGKVLVDGKMMAGTERPALEKGKKELIFRTRSKSSEVVESVLDSSGKATGNVKFSKSNIYAVETYCPDARGKRDTHIVYRRGIDPVKVLLVFFIVLGAVAAGVVINYIFIQPLFDYLNHCYIATMVYGSYDAPQVLVLRKFRDEKLATYVCGRIVIALYYKLSPAFVRMFKNNRPVNTFIKSILDRLVTRLEAKEAGAKLYGK